MPAPSNIVHQTTSSTSTGNLTLGTVNGKRSFDTAFGHGATTNVFDYFIMNRDAAEWERGTGHMSDATTMVRDTVIESSNSNATVSFSAGTKDVTNDVPAATQLRAEAQTLAAATRDQVRSNVAVPGKNYLDNPSGAIVIAALGSTSDGGFDFEDWVVLTQSNAVTPSQVTDAENTTPFMMRLSQANASAQRFGRICWLTKNACRELRGQSVVLSARARMSASTTLRYAIVEWTGTADTITKDVVNDWTSATFTTGNFFTTTSTTVVATGSIALTANTLTDITALTGSVSSSMNNLAVLFWTDSTQAQNVTLDLGKVKLEKSAVATAYVEPDYNEALARCKTRYEEFGGDNAAQSFGFGECTSSTQALCMVVYSEKRVAPSISFSATSDFAITASNNSSLTCTSLSGDEVGVKGCRIVAQVTTGVTAGDASRFLANGTTSARIKVNARL
jgi:hypothetical protein